MSRCLYGRQLIGRSTVCVLWMHVCNTWTFVNCQVMLILHPKVDIISSMFSHRADVDMGQDHIPFGFEVVCIQIRRWCLHAPRGGIKSPRIWLYRWKLKHPLTSVVFAHPVVNLVKHQISSNPPDHTHSLRHFSIASYTSFTLPLQH